MLLRLSPEKSSEPGNTRSPRADLRQSVRRPKDSYRGQFAYPPRRRWRELEDRRLLTTGVRRRRTTETRRNGYSIDMVPTLFVNVELKSLSCKGSQGVRMHENASFTANQLCGTLKFEAVIKSGPVLRCVTVCQTNLVSDGVRSQL